jgi:hypothetical protein
MTEDLIRDEITALQAEFRRLRNLPEVTSQHLRELARWARQAKAAKGPLARQVTRADLAKQAATAGRVEQARRYLDAEPGADLTEDARSELIWDLLNGQVTTDALRAVLGLLRASDADALGRLFRDGRPRPAGGDSRYELRAERDEFTREYFEPGPGEGSAERAPGHRPDAGAPAPSGPA